MWRGCQARNLVVHRFNHGSVPAGSDAAALAVKPVDPAPETTMKPR
jgi:hypothetical protein